MGARSACEHLLSGRTDAHCGQVHRTDTWRHDDPVTMVTVASSREQISSNLTCAVFCLSGCHGSPRAVAPLSRCHTVTGTPGTRHQRRRRGATADGKVEVDRLYFVCDINNNYVCLDIGEYWKLHFQKCNFMWRPYYVGNNRVTGQLSINHRGYLFTCFL